MRGRIGARVKLRLRLPHRIRLRLGGGGGGSVPVATPDSVHGTCSEFQLSLATTACPHPSWIFIMLGLYKPTKTEVKGRLAM